MSEKTVIQPEEFVSVEPTSVLGHLKASMYHSVDVEIFFKDKILSGIPANDKSLEYYLEQKFATDAEKKDFRERMKAGAITEEEKLERENTNTCVFERGRDGYCCVWHSNLKSMLREGFTCLDIPGMIKTEGKGFKGATKQIFQHGLFFEPLYLPFYVDGKRVKQSTGMVSKVKHIPDGIGGTRSALGRHEYMGPGTTMAFTLKWLARSAITLDHVKDLFCFAENDGLGASRSMGNGFFIVTRFDYKPAEDKKK